MLRIYAISFLLLPRSTQCRISTSRDQDFARRHGLHAALRGHVEVGAQPRGMQIGQQQLEHAQLVRAWLGG